MNCFISYTQADHAWAEWIAWQLEENGLQTILQAWDFQAGCNFVLEMDSAAKRAQRTIAVLSASYVDAAIRTRSGQALLRAIRPARNEFCCRSASKSAR